MNETNTTGAYNANAGILTLSVSVSVLTFFLIVVGNSLTIICVSRTPELRTLTNMYIISLSVADFLVGCFIPLNYAALVEVSEFLHFNKFFCLTLLTGNLISVSVSVTTMILIAVDRYVYIVRPLNYVLIMTEQRTAIMIALSWLASVTLNLIPVFHNTWNPQIGCVFFKTVPDDFVTYYICLYYWTGSMISGVLYGVIFRIAWKQHKTVLAAHGQNAYSTLTKTSCRRLKLFFVVFGIYFVCWFPLTISYIINKFIEVPRWIPYFTIPLVYVNSGANCFVYALMNKDFKKAIKRLFSDIKEHVCSYKKN